MKDSTDSDPLVRIMRISVDSDQRRLLYHLSGSVEGCDKIAFDLNEAPELRQILQAMVNPPKAFSFTIDEHLGEGLCKIDSIDFNVI